MDHGASSLKPFLGFVEAILGSLETFLSVDQHEDEKRETTFCLIITTVTKFICFNNLVLTNLNGL
jgi:hypothetical protein